MSLYDYITSREISAQDYPFYALIMAAMRQADSNNIEKLKAIFPDTWSELHSRYHAPKGILPKEEATV